jgi:hypothetical protein
MPLPEPLFGEKKKGEAGGEEEKGEKEKPEARRTGKPHWGSLTPSHRWANRPLSGLPARPPEEGAPCVAAVKMEQFKPRSPTHQSPKSSR